MLRAGLRAGLRAVHLWDWVSSVWHGAAYSGASTLLTGRRVDDSSRILIRRFPQRRIGTACGIPAWRGRPDALYELPTIRPEVSPSNWHSIHKNDLARAMVAQDRAGIPRDCPSNAPKEPTSTRERRALSSSKLASAR
jgi:hypothetical protein